MGCHNCSRTGNGWSGCGKVEWGESMTTEDARKRIQSAIDQFGGQAGTAIDLVISEVRSSLGNETANDLIDEFDLELQYNIAPTEPEGSGD